MGVLRLHLRQSMVEAFWQMGNFQNIICYIFTLIVPNFMPSFEKILGAVFVKFCGLPTNGSDYMGPERYAQVLGLLLLQRELPL